MKKQSPFEFYPLATDTKPLIGLAEVPVHVLYQFEIVLHFTKAVLPTFRKNNLWFL